MWWTWVLIVLFIALGIYGFAKVAGWNTQRMTKHRDDWSLDEIYHRNRDTVNKQRRARGE